MSSKCPKCGEPVYHAERKTILGRDWHSRCLRCDNCDKALTPGQHSAHLNKPYCNTCYQAMFGPEGFRQGSVEPRKVIIKGAPPARRDTYSKSDLKSKIKDYNLYKTNPTDKLKSRETNGQLLFEGLLKLYWGLKQPIILSPGVMYNNRRQSSMRGSMADFVNINDEAYEMMLEEAASEKKRRETLILQEKSEKKVHQIVSSAWDSKERMPRLPNTDGEDGMDLTASLPAGGFNSLPSTPTHRRQDVEGTDGNAMSVGGGSSRQLTRGNSLEPGSYNSRSPIRKRSASFRKISKQKRIEGKSNSEMPSKFTPPYGTPTSVRVTSTIPTKDVILMLIAKYKVENPVSEFNLCVVYDNGIREYLSDEDYPLQKRLKLGPNEDIAKIFIMGSSPDVEEQKLPEEVAVWVKFSLTELQQFNRKFEEECDREGEKIKKKFESLKDELRKHLQNGRPAPLQTDV